MGLLYLFTEAEMVVTQTAACIVFCKLKWAEHVGGVTSCFVFGNEFNCKMMI
jgi:hypothetical protein